MIDVNRKRLPAHFVRFTISPLVCNPLAEIGHTCIHASVNALTSTMESWVIIRAEPHRDNNMKGLRGALVAVALLGVAQFVLFDDAI